MEPTDADTLYTKAQNYARAGDHAQAVTAYSAALEHNPQHAKARLGRGMALQQIGKHQSAIYDFSNVIDAYKDWAGLYVAYYSRAFSQKSLGRLEETVDDCSRAIVGNPNCIDARYLRGTSLKGLGRSNEAIEDLNAVLLADPNYHEAYYARGTLFHLQERWEEAIADFSAFLNHESRPNGFIVDCHRLRGIAAYELGRYEAALEDLSLAIKSNPTDAMTYFRRSQVYKAMGDTDRAQADFTKGTSLLAAC